jgi:hypothetical protein
MCRLHAMCFTGPAHILLRTFCGYILPTKKEGAQSHSPRGTAKHPANNVKERPKGTLSTSFIRLKFGGFLGKTYVESQ